MAIGDEASAAGIPVVPSTKDIRLGYQDINNLADQLARREAALSSRANALESSTQVNTGTPVFSAGWSDAGSSVVRVGRLVTVVVRAIKNDVPVSGETIFTVPAQYRPTFGEVGSVGYLSGASFLITPVPLQSDGKVRIYYIGNPGTDRSVSALITFIVS